MTKILTYWAPGFLPDWLNLDILALKKTSGPEDRSVALGAVKVYSRVCPHSFHILHIFMSKFARLCNAGPLCSVLQMRKKTVFPP